MRIQMDFVAAEGIADALMAQSDQMASYSEAISSVSGRLPGMGSSDFMIRAAIRTLSTECGNEGRLLRTLSAKLRTVIRYYREAEQAALEGRSGDYGPSWIDDVLGNLFDGDGDADEPDNPFAWEASDWFELIGQAGIIGTFISTVGSMLTGDGELTDYLNLGKNLSDLVGGICGAVEHSNWAEALFGLDDGIKTVADQLDELNLGNATSTAGKAAVVAKWAGYAFTGLINLAENAEEFDGTGNYGRMVGETVFETATDIGLTIGATAAVSAGLTALGVVSAPAVVVGGLAVGVVWGANAICEWATGGRDLGEVVGDFAMDVVEGAGELISDAAEGLADLASDVGGAIADGASAIWDGICSWF
ncbi:MAG: hypothetical protein J6Z22_07370 [Lachnospiraceae bacterium]|nr:hypothetical protein [Lachnospiraceae bacterium]